MKGRPEDRDIDSYGRRCENQLSRRSIRRKDDV